MKFSAKHLLWLFFGVAALNLIGVGLNLRGLELISKPLIMISLIAHYWVVSEKRSALYLIAMFFSFLGDVLLLDKESLFLYGIGAFLMTQLIYIVLVIRRTKVFSPGKVILSAIPFLVYLFLLIGTLAPELNAFFYPVLVYGIVISVFGITSLNYQLSSRTPESRILLTGAVLFIGSDSMIALNKFYSPHMIYPVAIMLTYALAQYLICESVLQSEASQQQ